MVKSEEINNVEIMYKPAASLRLFSFIYLPGNSLHAYLLQKFILLIITD